MTENDKQHDEILMMMMAATVDLHTHTYFSDGELSPAQLVAQACRAGLRAIAVTDHDTIAGIAQAQAAAKKLGTLEIVSGVELSCDIPADNHSPRISDIHVLGLYINPDNLTLAQMLTQAAKMRLQHKKAVIKKLQQLGFKITFAEVKSLVKGQVGRPHIAQILMKKYPSRFTSVRQVFDEYFLPKKPAHVESEKRLSLQEAIKVIHQANGVAILAHPGRFDEGIGKKVLAKFVELGGDGLEVYYAYSSGKETFADGRDKNAHFRAYAERHRLLFSGGSDFHGKIKAAKLNDALVPYDILATLRERALRYRQHKK